MAEYEEAGGVSSNQIKLFKKFEEVKDYGEKLSLTRVFVQDIPNHDTLDGCYIGGRVVNVASESYSQGHDSLVFVDDGESGKDTLQVLIRVGGELVELLPSIDTGFMVFVAGAYFEDEDISYSQDTGKCVIAKGSDVSVWVIHPQIDNPRLYEKSFGPKWWRRRKRNIMERREAKQARRAAESKANQVNQRAPASSGLSQWAPSTLGNGMFGDSNLNGISCWQPSPESISYGAPKPSSVSHEGQNPSSVSHGGQNPSSISRGGQNPSSISYGIANASSVNRGGHNQSSISYERPTVSRHVEITGDQKSSKESSFPDDMSFAESSSDGRASTSSESSDASSTKESSSEEEVMDASWSPKKASSRYKYIKLGDLQAGLKKINVIGVVKEYIEPRQSRGTQYNSVVTLVDESNPLVGVKCVLFNSNVDKLPQVKREGDIVCLHRINTNEYRNVLQIEGPPFSSSMRFSSKLGRKLTPKTGSLSYTFSASERQRVRELRRWVLHQKRASQSQLLETVKEGLKFGLLCQVVWLCLSASGEETVLSVWDGSVCPLPSKPCLVSSDHINSDHTLNTTVGPELQQQITIKGRPPPDLKIKPGSYVFISNVEASVNAESGDTELRTCGKLTKNVELVSVREACHSDLKERLKVALAAQTSVTHTPHEHVGQSSLLEVKECANDQEFSKFRCKAKLVTVLTPTLEDTVHVVCDQCKKFKPISRSDLVNEETGLLTVPCAVCSEAGQQPHPPHPRCLFCVRLLLRDHSGSLEVYLVHDEAIAFFRGLKPTNFYKNQLLRFKLSKMLYYLSGENAPFSQKAGDKIRPWINCCVFKAVGPTETHYFLFDTSLVSQN